MGKNIERWRKAVTSRLRHEKCVISHVVVDISNHDIENHAAIQLMCIPTNVLSERAQDLGNAGVGKTGLVFPFIKTQMRRVQQAVRTDVVNAHAFLGTIKTLDQQNRTILDLDEFKFRHVDTRKNGKAK